MSLFLTLLLCAVGVFVFLLGILFLALTVYLAFVHSKYAHLPSPKRPSFYFGHLYDIWKMAKEMGEEASLPVMVDYWSRDVKSKTFVTFFFHTPILIVMEPSIIKSIVMDTKNNKTRRFAKLTAKAFGVRLIPKGLIAIESIDTWTVRRKMYDPAFKKGYLKDLTVTFNTMINSTVSEIKTFANGKTVIPLRRYITRLAADIISQVAFGTDFRKIWTPSMLNIHMPKEVQIDFFNYMTLTLLRAVEFNFTAFLPSLSQYLHPIEARKYRECILGLRKMGYDCIKRRIKLINEGGDIPNDILTYMLSNNKKIGSIEDLVDDFLTFYVAGQDTTANTVMFAIILLWQHPNVLERVKEEIKEVLGDREQVTSDDLDRLQYLEQVFSETLRLYPPSFGIQKILHSDTPTKSGLIPAGTEVMLVSTNMCRKSEFFEDPDAFKPERFDPDNERPSSFVYFPFGVGHRACIGRHFALMEAKMVLARLLQTFTITFPDDYELQVAQRALLQPKDDLLCTITVN